MEIFVNNIQDANAPVGISQLGTVVFDNIVFPADPQGAYPELRFDAVSLSVNRPKNIVRSRISGRDGDIKEYTGSGDYEITLICTIGSVPFAASQAVGIAAGLIPGVNTIAGVTGATPDLEDLRTVQSTVLLDRFIGRVPIESKYLNNLFNINFVVVDNCQWNKTSPDTWTVQFDLLSDNDTDLRDFG